jgi:hypothetical protein
VKPGVKCGAKCAKHSRSNIELWWIEYNINYREYLDLLNCPVPLPSALCPVPSALGHQPCAIRPVTSALYPVPSALCPRPCALRSVPSALCPPPCALCPTPCDLCPMNSNVLTSYHVKIGKKCVYHLNNLKMYLMYGENHKIGILTFLGAYFYFYFLFIIIYYYYFIFFLLYLFIKSNILTS